MTIDQITDAYDDELENWNLFSDSQRCYVDENDHIVVCLRNYNWYITKEPIKDIMTCIKAIFEIDWIAYGKYNSLAELNAEWEDYEEPKEYWHIDFDGDLMKTSDIKCDSYVFDKLKEIGNYFETKEDAEKAVEKLKAWKRLKDNGFRFKDFGRINDCATIIRATSDKSWSEIYDDLDLLFGGEE